jgi:fatty acid desaturase
MGKEFVMERHRIERMRMRNRWFYVTSLVAALGILGWIGGGAVWVLLALIVILGLNVALPIETYFRLRGAMARDRAKS